MSESPIESTDLAAAMSDATAKPRKGAARRRPHIATGQALHEDDDAVLGHPGAHAAHAIQAPVIVTGHALRPE